MAVSSPIQYDYKRVVNVGLTVEGIGDTVGSYRFVARAAPSYDTLGLYRVALLGWPDTLGAKADFRRGESEIETTSFRLRRTSTILSQMWNINPLVRAETTAPRTASATTILLNNTGLDGALIHWERECIKLGTHTGGGTYTGCTRGFLGTFARRHGSYDGWDREVFSTLPPGSLKGRVVKFFVIYEGANSYADEEVMWMGTLDNLVIDGGTELVLEARSLLGWVQSHNLMTFQRRWGPVANEAQITDRPDSGYGSSLARKSIVVSARDKRAALCQWHSYPVIGAPVYRLQFVALQPVGGAPLPEDLRGEEEYYEVISTVDEAPANAVTPDTFTLPLSRDPATLVLQLLTTIPNNGVQAENGDYDLGLDNLAGDLDETLVDIDGILAWGRTLGDATVDNLWLGLEGKPEPLWDVLKRILHPLSSVLTTNTSGQITVAAFKAVAGFNQQVFVGQDEVVSIGHNQDRAVYDTVTSVIIEYDKGPARDAATITGIDARKNRRLPPGDRSSLKIEAWYYTGVGAPSARALGIGLSSAFRIPPPTVTLDLLRTVNLGVGQVAHVTHDKLIRSAAIGWDNERTLVVASYLVFDAPAFADGGIGRLVRRVELLHTGSAYNTNLALIGPSALVTAWNGTNHNITTENLEFASANNDFFSRDASAFVAGDKVQIVDEYGTVKVALATVQSVSTNVIRLTGSVSPSPAAGDVVRLAKWTDATSEAREKWTFISDDDNTLNGFVTQAYSYSE